MKTQKLKYWLMFYSRIDERVSAAVKYNRFREGIKDLAPPWGVDKKPFPPFPKDGHRGATVISLTRFFGVGVREATLLYKYRYMVRDDGLSDDLLNIIFNPAKVDLHYLIYTVIPSYIEAFDAYLVEYFDDYIFEFA